MTALPVSGQQALGNLAEQISAILQIENPHDLKAVSGSFLRGGRAVPENQIGDSGNVLVFPGNQDYAAASHGVLDHVGFVPFLVFAVDLDAEFFGRRGNRLLRAKAIAMLTDARCVKMLGNGKPRILQHLINRVEECRQCPCLLPALRNQGFRVLVTVDVHSVRRAGISRFFGVAYDHYFFAFILIC